MAVTRSPLRHFITSAALLIGFAVVLFRLVNLQILQASELSSRADRQHRKVVTVEGARGTIYDRNGKVLAMNVDVPSVFGLPAQLDQPRKVARALAPILRVRPREIEKKLKQDRNFVWLARKLDPEQGRRLERLSPEGIGMMLEGRRYYPKGSLLSHVLGFAGVDNQGLEGLERRYESHLRGKKHVVVLHRDALGRTVFPEAPKVESSTAGHNVTLTIDEFIQYTAEKELERAVKDSRAKRGTIIVMEPRSGAVLAMAVNPRFDPNIRRRLSPARWRNRAVTDVYEPGSTLKTVLAAAVLEEKVFTPRTLVYGENGRMTVARTVIHDHERSGWMTFSQVIERSSNVGSVKAGLALGAEKFYHYLRAFGFGDRTEIDLPGESAGLVKTLPEWGRRTLASMAIGQEVAVTPIQLVTAVSAIANGGWLMKPFLVSEIRTDSGRVVFQASPRVRRRPVSTETVRALNQMLENVVVNGTGTKATVAGARVAGKTGTAEKIDPKTKAYSSSMFVASFVGYIPAGDPQITILVVIDEPQGESWGGVIAAPVFRRVAEQVLPYLRISHQGSTELAMAWNREGS